MYNPEFDLMTKAMYSDILQRFEDDPMGSAQTLFHDWPDRQQWLDEMSQPELRKALKRDFRDFWLEAGCSEETAELVAHCYTDASYKLYQAWKEIDKP